MCKTVEIDSVAYKLLLDKQTDIKNKTNNTIPIGVIAELIIKRHIKTEDFSISVEDLK